MGGVVLGNILIQIGGFCRMTTETDFAQILEKLERKIEAGQARTDAKLDQVIGRIEVLEVGQARLEEKINSINQRFEQVDQRFEQVNQRFEQVDQRFDKMDQRFERIEDNLNRQDNRLWGFLVAFGIALLGIIARYAFFMPKI